MVTSSRWRISMESPVVRTFVLVFGALILACAGSGRAAPAYLMAAVSDPERPAEQVELDQWRKPAEVIPFPGLKLGDRIPDFMSGNPSFTRIFSKLAGPECP